MGEGREGRDSRDDDVRYDDDDIKDNRKAKTVIIDLYSGLVKY